MREDGGSDWFRARALEVFLRVRADGGEIYHKRKAGECNNCATNSCLTFRPARASGAFAAAFRPRSARRLGQGSSLPPLLRDFGEDEFGGEDAGGGRAGSRRGRGWWRGMESARTTDIGIRASRIPWHMISSLHSIRFSRFLLGVLPIQLAKRRFQHVIRKPIVLT